MTGLQMLINTTRHHAELRIRIDQHHAEIELWTNPAPADARQNLMWSSRSSSTETAALDLLDQITTDLATPL